MCGRSGHTSHQDTGIISSCNIIIIAIYNNNLIQSNNNNNKKGKNSNV